MKDHCYRKVKATYAVFPSARASQAIAKCRKGSGNVRKTEKGTALKRWQKEKWKDQKTGKACGAGGSNEYCRPSKRVSSKTPKTSGEMSSAEKKKKIAEKSRVGMGARVSPLRKRKNMKKQASFIIPTVIIKSSAMSDFIINSPIGDIKPFNPTHAAIAGSLASGLGVGGLATLAQYLTEEGRKKSLKEKIKAALLPALLGSGVGAFAGSTMSNISRGANVDAGMRQGESSLKIADKVMRPGFREAVRDINDSYLQEADIRDLNRASRGEQTPLTAKRDEQMKDTVLDYLLRKEPVITLPKE